MTFVEVLVTIVISAIAMFAMAAPLIAERRFWSNGKQQTDAQREAQMALRAISNAARESGYYESSGGWLSFYETKSNPSSCRVRFSWDIAAKHLLWKNPCSKSESVLVGGGLAPNLSEVTSFLITPISSKLVGIELQVRRGQQQETLATTICLRNAT